MNQNNLRLNIITIGILFFIFGFVTWLNSILIPFLKQICQLTDFQAYLVTFAFYISYFVMALPSSRVLKKIGFVRGMSAGLVLMAVGSLIFIPAALQRSYILFLTGLFFQGGGLTLLQTAANPYAAMLGPIESAAQRISIMGVGNKIAGMIGILLFSYLLFNDINVINAQLATVTGAESAALLDQVAHNIITPYVVMAAVLLLLGLSIPFTHLPEIDPMDNAPANGMCKKSVFGYPHLWLGVLSIFLYVGAEVVAIDTLALYGGSQGISPETASRLGTYSLIALVAGYLVGIASTPRYISQRTALAVCAVMDIVFLAGALLTTGILSIFFIVMLSFGHAMMWPSIWPLSLDGLGKCTATGSAVLIMGVAGGAILPLCYGAWADALGGNRHLPYLILLPCYLYILAYALRLYRVGKVPAKSAEKTGIVCSIS